MRGDNSNGKEAASVPSEVDSAVNGLLLAGGRGNWAMLLLTRLLLPTRDAEMRLWCVRRGVQASARSSAFTHRAYERRGSLT
jgi:hypothetical protein